MPEPKRNIIVGGDPEMTRAMPGGMYELIAASCTETPCEQCGRKVLLAAEGQRIALGEPVPMGNLDRAALAENRIAIEPGSETTNEGPATVVCMWCLFADNPKVIGTLDEALARARHILARTFVCPRCGALNPHDRENGYCGRCHDFTGEKK